ncbi:alpha-1,6-mannosylglycoprotein 6-beta-N-acetylglucosaminyltransferase A isoform X1 [Lingula anatina]|uniref:alpha-1,6-mannosyl-glycoprotein 6-beta-N-acetylglucosaminyltransferase n=1 Tax=Lingula anatina TaxID=7574 RepID=A0A1S3KFQ4_LINAN|nr:alpha-1,6-mannosylglycoprotein 6-beta-N-acetylglucosaminyltransferase A isoform X1 [Lingula anatina]XP_013421290.1 alpha-1,6-mannosylglycoprotein 6-beta-N-acetylglucosaminyltransferase A isoform X1 [Lingula anatina]XP_013421291.1 alpha-1,6-mannosylglycoprotein 6-beta-N-acetylglucosaminyltransferase A isoform X1 [Lingula anatina]XP_013421292.1 alpha-1,6-mannosylglycoprotein 6-beta-N-acetylglucosaminyltransferase A isoform X1 [Lingula anatina]|eukprot:XP_013421289.1 alpha-1,6-mannosylglycoprotein 6-beta-N-acetylglucosaminyltransferase A isoform X1 [Lingula anatina]
MIKPNRARILLLVIVLLWFATVLHLASWTDTPPKTAQAIQEEIVQLSAQYVKALAAEQRDIVDGPYSGRLTSYDLKKTLAVLLEHIMGRLDKMENKFDSLLNGTSYNLDSSVKLSTLEKVEENPMGAKGSVNALTEHKRSKKVTVQQLLQGEAEKCSLPDDHKYTYPHCLGKVDWMKGHWKSDKCYSNLGVDGSVCSFIIYLSEVENWCPKFPWRLNVSESQHLQNRNEAIIPENAAGLMNLLTDSNSRKPYAWIRHRIQQIWPKWKQSAIDLNSKSSLKGRKQKNILIHIGALTKQSGFKFAETADKGGPLGELLQWSDIITSLYLLGHKLTITSEVEELRKILSKFPDAKIQCQVRSSLPVDVIFTDIVGLKQFKQYVGHGYGKFSCLLRVIDSFGTEPSFNHDQYAKAHKMMTTWGRQNLIPQQFFNMFPHTPDNSFIGFVVETPDNISSLNRVVRKEDQALVYGKHLSMWKGKKQYLDIIHEFFEIHSTFYAGGVKSEDKQEVPSYVINHGILSPGEIQKLLRESKIFVGLGFPYEGPAPLEAIAAGCVFLNPKFSPPHTSQNTKFFKGKPTLREVTSQHPYAEVYIHEPYVYTVDINNLEELRTALRKIKQQSQVEPYLPYEYSEEGMLQRVNIFLEKQDFCRVPVESFVPDQAVQTIIADTGKSCKDVCHNRGLICEPSHFTKVNNKDKLKQMNVECTKSQHSGDIFYPSLHEDSGTCTFQTDPMLFSCVGSQEGQRRICPCRNYIKGQIAVCEQCL